MPFKQPRGLRKKDECIFNILEKVFTQDGISKKQLMSSLKISRDLMEPTINLLESCGAISLLRTKHNGRQYIEHHITDIGARMLVKSNNISQETFNEWMQSQEIKDVKKVELKESKKTEELSIDENELKRLGQFISDCFMLGNIADEELQGIKLCVTNYSALKSKESNRATLRALYARLGAENISLYIRYEDFDLQVQYDTDFYHSRV